MAITSADIHNQSFSIDRKGYDVDEVDVFLEHVANEIDDLNLEIEDLTVQRDAALNRVMDQDERDFDATVAMPFVADEEEEAEEELSEDVAELKARIADLEKQLAEKTANDAAIAQALIVAQRSADDVVENARAEGVRLVKDAEKDAARILNKAESDRTKVYNDIRDLEEEREEVRLEYREMLNDFMADATRKLSVIEEYKPLPATAAHVGVPLPASKEPVSAFFASNNEEQSNRIEIPAPATLDKDLSGFGDVDVDFDFDDID